MTRSSGIEEDRRPARPPPVASRWLARVHGPWPRPLLVLLALILPPYLLVRWAFTRRWLRLEDHDSVAYLANVGAFRSGDLREIIALSPDHTPFYPMMGALFTLPGWSPETAARLVSLAFSVVLLVAVLALTLRLGGRLAAVAAGVLLTFSPVFVPLSYAVLTEPSYIATVYGGLLLLWIWRDRPTVPRGLTLGLIFGLAFLNRIEGLLFLAAVPAFQGLHFVVHRPRPYVGKRLLLWASGFVITFAVLAAPQVWRVSHEMGAFAVNGRQAWSALLLSEGTDRPERRLYGLDYSASEINLEHVWRNPEVRQELGAHVERDGLLKHALFNLDTFNREYLSDLAGPLVIGLFAIGMVALLARRRYFALLLVFGIVAVGLAAPLVQSNLLLRHVAIIAPILFVGAGLGVAFVAGLVGPPRRDGALRWTVAAATLALVLAQWVVPLHAAYNRNPNRDYDPPVLQEPVRLLIDAARTNGGAPPVLVTRRHYITHKSGAVGVHLPHTDYDGLVSYLGSRGAQFLFLEYAALRDRPFAEDFRSESPPPDFVRLYRGTDGEGEGVELYRFVPRKPVDPSTVQTIEGGAP